MFERSVDPEPAALVERIGAAWRSENRAVAAQLIAIGELFAYRLAHAPESEGSGRWDDTRDTPGHQDRCLLGMGGHAGAHGCRAGFGPCIVRACLCG